MGHTTSCIHYYSMALSLLPCRIHARPLHPLFHTFRIEERVQSRQADRYTYTRHHHHHHHYHHLFARQTSSSPRRLRLRHQHSSPTDVTSSLSLSFSQSNPLQHCNQSILGSSIIDRQHTFTASSTILADTRIHRTFSSIRALSADRRR
jgi:hypothetical protein